MNQYLVILSQGRSGGTLIERILNTVPGVIISGENERAFDHLRRFSETMKSLQRHRDGEFYEHAWKAPPGNACIMRHLREFVEAIYGPGKVIGFKEIRYGDEEYDAFASAVDWLRELLPGLKIIFNVRDTQRCIQSGWWADDKAKSTRILEKIRRNFERYHAASGGATYWLPYEELHPNSTALRGLFSFLGIEFRHEYMKPLSIVLR